MNVGISGIRRIEKSNLVDDVTLQMQSLIEAGTWCEGDKLASENRLAKSFNVSRIVIREALQGLRSLNMIVTRQGLGSFVCNPNNFVSGNILEISAEDFQSLQILRRSVEMQAILLAKTNATHEDMEKISHALNQMRENVGDCERFTDADLAFHIAVVESGHSKLLNKAYISCRDELRFVLLEMNRIPDSHTYAIMTHQQIYQYIWERNSSAANEMLKEMSDFNGVRYEKLFKHKEERHG